MRWSLSRAGKHEGNNGCTFNHLHSHNYTEEMNGFKEYIFTVIFTRVIFIEMLTTLLLHITLMLEPASQDAKQTLATV